MISLEDHLCSMVGNNPWSNHRLHRAARARRRSAGWTTSAFPLLLFLFLLLCLVIPGLLSEMKAVRVVSITVFPALILFVLVRHRLTLIRVGTEVEVTQTGKHLARRGAVVKVSPFGMFFEVRLHETRDEAATIPTETVEMSEFNLKKIFFHR